jgi:hypothetical protein
MRKNSTTDLVGSRCIGGVKNLLSVYSVTSVVGNTSMPIEKQYLFDSRVFGIVICMKISIRRQGDLF